MKTECDYLYRWIKITTTNAKISPKRDMAWNAEEKEENLSQKLKCTVRTASKHRTAPVYP